MDDTDSEDRKRNRSGDRRRHDDPYDHPDRGNSPTRENRSARDPNTQDSQRGRRTAASDPRRDERLKRDDDNDRERRRERRGEPRGKGEGRGGRGDSRGRRPRDQERHYDYDDFDSDQPERDGYPDHGYSRDPYDRRRYNNSSNNNGDRNRYSPADDGYPDGRPSHNGRFDDDHDNRFDNPSYYPGADIRDGHPDPRVEIDFDSVINDSRNLKRKEEQGRPLHKKVASALSKLFKRSPDDTSDLDPDSPQHHAKATPSVSQGSLATGDSVVVPDDQRLVYGQDENEERGNWSGRFDFILSMLGYAVGLGNVWRFPYLCYRNGGGAFLFPFLIMMVVIGLPLFYLEASLGQFSSRGAMTCWEFSPLFKGVGIAMVMVSALTGIYYNMILGWSLHYLFNSFTSDLPWTTCTNDWNSKNCKLLLPIMPCDQDDEERSSDGSCRNEYGREIGLWNQTLFTEVTKRKLISPTEEYWNNHVLDFSTTIDDFGLPKWDLVLCLLLAWVICFLCLIKGIKTTGKVVYFTAIFPYVVLVILFFRGVTLEDAGLGIRYFITPDFGRLLDANVWKDAANQIFFSMSIAGGGLITLSSYNRFHNNILRDSLIVAIGDSMTCVLGGFVIFSFLGYMAGKLDVGIEDVAADGAGLAFVVYPEAVSSLPPSTLWALLFFFMLLTLGLDSQFAMIETVLTGVLDQYPFLRPKKTLVILSICCLLFLLGLPLTCPGGMYLLQLMDNYVGGMSLIILGAVELVAVILVYGGQRFCKDINLMTGSTNFIFWQVTWYALSPLTLVFIFIFMFVDYKRSTYGDDYTYPVWADVLGWMFTLASVLAIPITMLFRIAHEGEGSNAWQKFQLLCLPTVYWGPALPKHRQLVTYVSDFKVDPYENLTPKGRSTYVNYGFSADGDSVIKPSLATPSLASLAPSQTSLPSNRASLTSNGSLPRMKRHNGHPVSLTPSSGGQSYESNV